MDVLDNAIGISVSCFHRLLGNGNSEWKYAGVSNLYCTLYEGLCSIIHEKLTVQSSAANIHWNCKFIDIVCTVVHIMLNMPRYSVVNSRAVSSFRMMLNINGVFTSIAILNCDLVWHNNNYSWRLSFLSY